MKGTRKEEEEEEGKGMAVEIGVEVMRPSIVQRRFVLMDQV